MSYRVGDDDDGYWLKNRIKYDSAITTALGRKKKMLINILREIRLHAEESNPFYDPCYEEFINRNIKVRVKKLFKGNTDLILGFNILLPKKLHFTLPLQLDSKTTGKKVKVEANCELPWDVLDIISKTLDFDGHFQFAGVCKSWRDFHKIYWRNFLASQEPLLLQFSTDGRGYGKGSFSFISIPDQKIYCSEMLKYFLHDSIYVTSSSGYLIFARKNKSFVLINPFTRIKKVIDTSTCEFDYYTYGGYYVLLAFGKCSEEFVLVVLYIYKSSLHVYQSRNREWVTYSTMKNLGEVDDFVVLHDKIYVVTDKANIGVLNLNSANIKFLKLKSTPDASLFYSYLKLVNCDEQLFMVSLSVMHEIRNVYKIDFSTMNYVRLETLDDIALFYASNKHFYALSNPNMWGYESNSVYVIGPSSKKYDMYLEDDKKLHKDIMLPAPLGADCFKFDWYFRHLQYEVDYSLVE